MNVTIYSREEIETMIAEGKFPGNTAVISFYDPAIKRIDQDYTHVDYSGVCDHVFYSELDDLDLEVLKDRGYTYDTYFSEADEIAKFVYQAYHSGMDIICQCEYGQSRSAGCAAAILEHFYHTGISVFVDYRRYPNQVVYHKVFDALESLSFQPAKYLQRVHDYSGTKYPFNKSAIEESLNRLTQTERDVLYAYLWKRNSVISIADQYGYSDLRIEQILSKCHRKLAHYIASGIRR